jgi:hypothetical protein
MQTENIESSAHSFNTSYEKAIDALSNTLNMQDGLIKIVHCLFVVKVTPDEIEKLVLSCGDEVNKNLPKAAIDKVIEKINEKKFLTLIENHQNKDYIFELFTLAKGLRLDSFTSIIESFDHNVSIIYKYRNILASKKTQSIKKDKWGDIDESLWAKTLSEFANDKLIGMTYEGFMKMMPEEVTLHFEMHNLDEILGRFAWYALSANIKPNDAKAENESPVNATLETGEDFEIYIKNLIELENSDVIVEITPRTGDHGADLIVNTEHARFAIQAKYYTGNVGNAAVQEIYAAKDYYDANFAIVVTNSDYTTAARVLASKLGVLLSYDHEIAEVIKTITSQ